MSQGYYADAEHFRTGNGDESLEAGTFFHGDRSVFFELGSWDAPNLSIRLQPDVARAFAKWLLERVGDDLPAG